MVIDDASAPYVEIGAVGALRRARPTSGGRPRPTDLLPRIFRGSGLVLDWGDQRMDEVFITSLWGVLTLFGVFVSLLVTRSEEILRHFTERTSAEMRDRAANWARLTRGVSIGSLVVAALMSLIWGVAHDWAWDLPGDPMFWLLVVAIASQLAFIIVIWRLVPLPKFVTLRVRPCTDRNGLKSTSWNNNTTVLFRNNSSIDLKLYWVDYKGNEILREQLSPQEVVGQKTWETHPFVIRDAEQRCIAIFLPDKSPGEAIISEDTVRRASVKEPDSQSVGPQKG